MKQTPSHDLLLTVCHGTQAVIFSRQMFRPLSILFAAFMILTAGDTAWAAAQFYTNQSTFNAAITGASFTTNLSSLPAGQVDSPATFSGNGLSVQALSTNTGVYNLYSFGNGLTVNSEGYDLLFTNFSLAATAVGGLFFNLDTEGNFASGNLVLNAVFADSSSMTTNVPSASTNSFFGFVGDTNLLSLTVSGQAGLPTAGQLTLGAPVPEPSTYALILLSSGALAAYAAARRRGRA